jgi:hypothetical protein
MYIYFLFFKFIYDINISKRLKNTKILILKKLVKNQFYHICKRVKLIKKKEEVNKVIEKCLNSE